MIEICGCLPFFYKTNQNEKSCNINGLDCIEYFKNVFREESDKCLCPENCEDTRFGVKSQKIYSWFRSSTLRWELDTPKFRIKREIIYSFTDVLGSNLLSSLRNAFY